MTGGALWSILISTAWLEMRNAALSSTNIRDYVYKGKCLLPVQETGSRWASDVWRASPRCQRAMGEGCVWKRNGEIG